MTTNLEPDLLERLTDAVNRLTAEVRVVRDVLDETREDWGWFTRNGRPHQAAVHTKLVCMARDPLASDWNERLEFQRFTLPNSGESVLASEQFDELILELAEVITETGQEQIDLLLSVLDDVRFKLAEAIKSPDGQLDTVCVSQALVIPAPHGPSKQRELF